MKFAGFKMMIGISCTLVLIITASIVAINTMDNNKIEKDRLRANYAAYDSNPPGLSFGDIKIKVDESEKKSDLTVVGEVIGSEGEIKLNMPGEKGTPEAAVIEKNSQNGNEQADITFVQTRIKVLETIKGQKSQQELTVIQNKMFAEYEPQFKPGMKVLLMLQKGKDKHEGKYWATKYGFFYITDDNKVVSAISDEEYNKYTGMDLTDFKNVIQGIENK